MTVFNTKHTDHTNKKLFLDEAMGMQRYETVKYPAFEKLTEKMIGFFWTPQEVDIMRDAKDFKELSEYEQHIFTSNLKRQIILDSVQGRSPNLAFLPLATLPELEAFIETWSFNETIHSRSYTYIIRNVYANPSKVFDAVNDNTEVMECAKSIAKYYDELIDATHKWRNDKRTMSDYQLKKHIWMAINSVNALEGVRFYVSFACAWAFAELKKMEGNAKIIKLICRDENVHLAATQNLIKYLPTDDPDFAKIAEETQEECLNLFTDVVDQEKAWAKYLFKDGSMIGLNEELLNQYVEWVAHKRLQSIKLPSPYKVPQANPLPWTQKWISGSEVQVAPQEVQVSSYILGGTVQDVDGDTFKDFDL